MLDAAAYSLRCLKTKVLPVLQLCHRQAQQQLPWLQQQQQQWLQHPVTGDTQLQAVPCLLQRLSSFSTTAIASSPVDATAGGAASEAKTSAIREPETPLLHAIRNRIMIRGGPLSVAEYMQEVLTNPVSGYYMQRDVFGTRGDFTTSPEISQMFGEVLGIWCVVIWQQLGCPSTLQLVELGPGRGTLMADLLRGTAAFKPFAEALKVCLVEVSPFLRHEQWKKLQCAHDSSSSSTGTTSSSSSSSSSISGTNNNQHAHDNKASSIDPSNSAGAAESNLGSSDTSRGTRQAAELLDRGISEINGAEVSWFSSLDAVPMEAPTLYIAHEFLDALPVHQFVKDPRRGWLEVMVDTVEEDSSAAASTPSTSTSSTSIPQNSYEGIPLVQTQPVQQQSDAQASTPSNQGLHLRFVLSPSPTPAAQLLVQRRLEALAPGVHAEHHQQQDVKQEPQQVQVPHSGGQLHEQQRMEQPQQAVQHRAIEIGAQAMAVVESLARRVAANGGAALLVDYGANKPYANSLTGIRNHRGVHPLSQPGTADLSAWVDFSAMRLAAEQAFDIQPAAAAATSGTAAPAGDTQGKAAAAATSAGAAAAAGGSGVSDAVEVFGPISQEHLLHSLGIQARLQSLAEAATPKQAEELLSGYQRLVDTGPGGMGGNYLALAITHKGLGVPVGFEPTPAADHDGAL